MNQLSFLLMGAPAAEGGGFDFTQLVPFLLIIVVIYFFMIRPQTKKAKEQKEFRENIKRGDFVVTIGGVHGKIADIRENTFIIDAGQNVRLTIDKAAVSMESSKGKNEVQS